MGTLKGFPNPPATGSHEQSSCSPTRYARSQATKRAMPSSIEIFGA